MGLSERNWSKHVLSSSNSEEIIILSILSIIIAHLCGGYLHRVLALLSWSCVETIHNIDDARGGLLLASDSFNFNK